MTLYEITDEFRQLLEMADECDLSQEDIADTLEGLEYEFEDKADAYAKVIRTLEGDLGSVEAELERLQNKKRHIQNNIKNMKKSLEDSMIQTGKTKFKTPLFGFRIQKNPPSLKIDDEKRVTHDFLIPQPPKIDMKAIKQYIKEGFEFDWCHMEQTESLRIT